MDPNEPVTITLEAQQWNNVLALLQEGPFRVAAPLIDSIMRQGASQGQQPGPQQSSNALGAAGPPTPFPRAVPEAVPDLAS
jgi:hypothetical protein